MSLRIHWKMTILMTALYAVAAVAGFVFIKDQLTLQIYLFVLFGILFLAGKVWGRRRA